MSLISMFYIKKRVKIIKKMLKIIFLSSSKKGEELLEYLKQTNCEIVYSLCESGRLIDQLPDYDLGISFLYSYKIPKKEITNKYKWINFHPAPLPELRGRNIAYHAIMNNMTYFGATLHYIDENFDTGDIIEIIKFPIEKYMTAGDLVELSIDALKTIFYTYIPMMIENSSTILPCTEQKSGQYFKKEKINDFIEITDDQSKQIRALTAAPNFYPFINIEGKIYQIIPIKNEK